jgi:nicotinamidase-related amidase
VPVRTKSGVLRAIPAKCQWQPALHITTLTRMIDQTCALLSIDMQQGFDMPSWPTRWNADVDHNGLALIDAWRRNGWPLIHVRHDSAEPASTLRPGQPGNAFRPGFGPRDGERLLTKSVNSAFIGTDLDLTLRRIGARSALVFGIATDMCVSTTIRTGANMGWPMALASDACDCFDLPGPAGVIPARAIHDAHVATLGFEFCKAFTTAEILAQAGR